MDADNSENSICKTWQLDPGFDSIPTPYPMQPNPRTLDEATLAVPAGAYTTIRTYNHNSAFRFQDHVQRLENSARLAGHPVLIDADKLRIALRSVLASIPCQEYRIRIHLDLSRRVGNFYISFERLILPSEEDYSRGVWTASVYLARQNPMAKLTSFVSTAAEIRRCLPAGAVEGLMLDPDGNILEGLSSNFFGVIHGEVVTAGASVLEGITRSIVLEEVNKTGIPLRLDPVPYEKIKEISEAFITSASRTVLPVVQIDQYAVGPGLPGPVTKMLRSRVTDRILQEIEPI